MPGPDSLIVSVIADYGALHDLAFAEVTHRLYAELTPFRVKLEEYSVPPFDTVATGFFLAQIGINSRLGERHIFYVNTAPRHDDGNPRKDAAGEALVYARIFNGVRIIAVNSGHSLSFVKDAAVETRIFNIENAGSQFRSRDFYPRALRGILAGESQILSDRAPVIPDLPKNVLCYEDGYGNLKLSVDPGDVADLSGGLVDLTIGGQTRRMRAGASIFDVRDGELCFAPGSSGWDLPDGRKIRFMEAVRRSGSAGEEFARPKGGAPVSWKKAS